MEADAIVSTVLAMREANFQQQVNTSVLRMAMDMQGQAALELLSSVPNAPAAPMDPTSMIGQALDVYA